MKTVLLVGFGGMLGTVLRYLLGLIPIQGDIPLITLLINFAGSFAIGAVAEFSAMELMSAQTALFFRTGVCGGFTTFSAFSLETYKLLESRKYAAAGAYMGLSIALCLMGVFLGILCARWLRGRFSA